MSTKRSHFSLLLHGRRCRIYEKKVGIKGKIICWKWLIKTFNPFRKWLPNDDQKQEIKCMELPLNMIIDGAHLSLWSWTHLFGTIKIPQRAVVFLLELHWCPRNTWCLPWLVIFFFSLLSLIDQSWFINPNSKTNY